MKRSHFDQTTSNAGSLLAAGHFKTMYTITIILLLYTILHVLYITYPNINYIS